MLYINHEADMTNAYRRRQWSNRGGYLVLKHWNPSLAWQEVPFATSTFWVQVHGFPVLWRCLSNLRKIGEKADDALEAIILDPKLVTFNPKSRVELFILGERQIASSKETTGHQGESIESSNPRYIDVTISPIVPNYGVSCSNSSTVVEEASTSRMVNVMNSIKFVDMCVVEAKSFAGGICIMWKSDLMCQQVEHNKSLIVIKVCIGDFNFTTNDNEFLGRNKGEAGSLANNYLKELIFEFGAIDLGYLGNSFTWARGSWGSSAIKRRLDRGIASISWRLAFPKAAVSHLGAINSNHALILLNTNPENNFAH
nr:hypothetical protein CFP56_65790 [Quercus suber]